MHVAWRQIITVINLTNFKTTNKEKVQYVVFQNFISNPKLIENYETGLNRTIAWRWRFGYISGNWFYSIFITFEFLFEFFEILIPFHLKKKKYQGKYVSTFTFQLDCPNTPMNTKTWGGGEITPLF